VRFTRRSTVHSRNALSAAGCSTSSPADDVHLPFIRTPYHVIATGSPDTSGTLDSETRRMETAIVVIGGILGILMIAVAWMVLREK
jgi:hypothetical protein